MTTLVDHFFFNVDLHLQAVHHDPLCDVESCSSLCCVGVRLPRRVTGSCSATQAMVTKVMSQAQLKALGKSAAKVIAGPPQRDHRGVRMKMNVKHCIFIV